MNSTKAIVIAALTALWVLLWNDPRPLVIVGGVIVATGTVLVFPFPQVALHGAFRPWAACVLVARFVGELVVASVQVGWLVVRPRPLPAPALIEVHLVSRSEALQVLTTELISLVPGSLLIELDAERGRAWLHVLNAASPALVEKSRRQARLTEHRVLAAFGTAAERDLSAQRLRQAPSAEGLP